MGKKRGLYGKYIIEKADGSPVDPDADYFVLRLDKDKWARHAALTYARTMRPHNPKLCDDITKRCEKYMLAALETQHVTSPGGKNADD